jgi:hypothetical protein
MKKKFLIVLISLFLLVPNVAFGAEEPIKVYVDGKRVLFSVNPILENGTTLVQFRPIFEKLNLEIGWDNQTQTVTGKKDELEIKIKIGEKTATVNGVVKDLQVPAKIINGYTFVPLRFIGEASEKKVSWDQENKIIQIGEQVKIDKYKRFDWGTNIETVKKYETLEFIGEEMDYDGYKILIYRYEDDDTIYNNGVEYTLAYRFSENQLVEFYIDAGASDNFDYMYRVYNTFWNNLFDFNGNWVSDEMWSDEITEEVYKELYRNDRKSMYEMAMRRDELTLITQYEYDDTEAGVIMMNHGSASEPEFGVALMYKRK